MAQRRMFTLQIVDSDAFLDMPVSSQLLYFHLSMRADDDGFIGNPKKIIRMVGAGEDDMKVLFTKRFILTFKSGVIVIKHWKMHNYIQNDRYHETQYLEEKGGLNIKDNGSYTERIQDVSKVEAEVRLGKTSIGEDRIEREPTPSQDAIEFFSGGKIYSDLLKEFSEGNNSVFIEKEFKKFIIYWTEKNKSGTKQKWQLQETFEVKRRLYTWLGRSNEYTKPKSKVAFV
jgi:hypothetical protein